MLTKSGGQILKPAWSGVSEENAYQPGNTKIGIMQ